MEKGEVEHAIQLAKEVVEKSRFFEHTLAGLMTLLAVLGFETNFSPFVKIG